MTGERVELQTRDGVMDCYVFRPADTDDDRRSGPWPAVVFYMDAFGVRTELGGMAQRIADAGHVVVVPNLYYRTGAFAPFEPAQVVADGPERVRFKGMIASIDNGKVMGDTASIVEYLVSRADVRDGSIAAVGYCMGGKFALGAAGTFPDRVAAAASIHGGALATDKDDSPHLLAGRIVGRLYVGVAGIDPGFTEAEQDRLEQALNDAGVDYVIETYENAKHGFAVTGHLAYDADASERHWRKLSQLLKDNL